MYDLCSLPSGGWGLALGGVCVHFGPFLFSPKSVTYRTRKIRLLKFLLLVAQDLKNIQPFKWSLLIAGYYGRMNWSKQLFVVLGLTSVVTGVPPQEFLREPNDQTAKVGDHVTLPCQVTNKKGMLQWTRDQFGLGMFSNKMSIVTIFGAKAYRSNCVQI